VDGWLQVAVLPSFGRSLAERSTGNAVCSVLFKRLLSVDSGHAAGSESLRACQSGGILACRGTAIRGAGRREWLCFMLAYVVNKPSHPDKRGPLLLGRTCLTPFFQSTRRSRVCQQVSIHLGVDSTGKITQPIQHKRAIDTYPLVSRNMSRVLTL
jgi:hypothetical protein